LERTAIKVNQSDQTKFDGIFDGVEPRMTQRARIKAERMAGRFHAVRWRVLCAFLWSIRVNQSESNQSWLDGDEKWRQKDAKMRRIHFSRFSVPCALYHESFSSSLVFGFERVVIVDGGGYSFLLSRSFARWL
jgi:hypothetical protein